VTQLALIPTLAQEPPPPQRIRKVWFAERDNPCGRRKLTCDFRLRERDLAELDGRARWRHAANLLAEWFVQIGGFNRVDERRFRAWAKLLDVYTPQQIRWAISAKARSLRADTDTERRRKRQYVPRPENFNIEKVAYWLALSPAHQQHLVAQRTAGDNAALRRRLDEARRDRRGLSQSAAEATARQAARQTARAARVAERLAAEQRFWEALSDAQRSAARRAVWRHFCEYAERCGVDPDDGQLDAVLRSWQVDWARQQWPCGTGLQPVNPCGTGLQPVSDVPAFPRSHVSGTEAADDPSAP